MCATLGVAAQKQKMSTSRGKNLLETERKKMIKHIVQWKLHDHAEGNSKEINAQKAKQVLESLNGKVPGLIRLEVGIDFSCTESSSDLVLYSEFETREALEEYPSHPEHLALKPFIEAIRCERRMIDYEV